jgi:hypothetical protein
MLKLLRTTKALSRPASDLVVPASPKALLTCASCDTECRVPADRGTIRVTCPGCGQKGLWSPPEAQTEGKPVPPGHKGRYPEEIRISCKAREGVAILTFKRFGFQGKGTYRLHQVETMPRGSGRAAIEQAVDRAEAPEIFPHDLIDWSDVACPHCHAAAAPIVRCGQCAAIACVSGVSKRQGGRYLACLCGNEGPIEDVEVVKLTQSRLGRVRDDAVASAPPSPSNALRIDYSGQR